LKEVMDMGNTKDVLLKKKAGSEPTRPDWVLLKLEHSSGVAVLSPASAEGVPIIGGSLFRLPWSELWKNYQPESDE
jgi:hypothetical protein